MKLSILKKQIAITVSLTILFLFIGFVSTLLFNQYQNEKFDRGPHKDFAGIVDKLVIEKKIPLQEAFKLIKDSINPNAPFQISLIPVADTFETEKQNIENDGLWEKFIAPPKKTKFLELQSSTDYVIKFEPNLRRPNDPPRDKIFIFNALILVLSTVFASVLSLTLLFTTMRKKSELAAEVLKKIKRGDLKVRFPIGKIDEISHLMGEFNSMADEVERVVEKLKNTDKERRLILQQLTHDLRTPIASLKNLLEIFTNGKPIPPETQKELIQLCLKEVSYFERLVEDLLFLAQINAPDEKSNQQEVSLRHLIEEEIELFKSKYPNKKIHLIVASPEESLQLQADPHLLQRLLRNALENAVSFARNEVQVKTKQDQQQIEIIISDDGPGLNQEAMKSFGNRKFSRAMIKSNDQRLSIGLGSVIMKSIAEYHQGQIEIQNNIDDSGQILGTKLKVLIPKPEPGGISSRNS